MSTLPIRFVSLVFATVFLASSAYSGEILQFRLFDGETVNGKLSLPVDTSNIRELVIYVHGTGPSTYDKRRGNSSFAFNYFDYFADEFTRRGIAFFTYNKRGVTSTDTAPYENIDRVKFRKAIPSVEVKDLATYIKTLRADKRLEKAKIILLGWSEGSILAAMAAENNRNNIFALFLSGYVHDRMSDVINWQLTGGSSMVNVRAIFDKDMNEVISRSEYDSDEKSVAAFRSDRMQNVKFDQLDANKDEIIDASDFKILLAAKYKAILEAIGKDDEDWIWNNYFHISVNWLKEHTTLEANKMRLLRLKLTIYIFHGENDANCPVGGVRELRQSFNKAKKKNLHEHIFPGHDHDLNFLQWLNTKKMPDGIREMFDTAERISR